MTLRPFIFTVVILLHFSATFATSPYELERNTQPKLGIRELIASYTKEKYCAIAMSERLSAFVIGATGEVGKAIVKELAKKSSFERVTLMTRRKIDFSQDQEPGTDYSKFEQKIVDFEKLSTDHVADFAGFDVGFCALGTTRGKSGHDGFIRVDHDYVMAAATSAKSGGCKHFNLVSSQGANKDSYFLYPRVKGQVEHEITELGFARLSIWRPGLLVCNRTESRMLESVAQFLANKIDRSRNWSIEVPNLARVMVNNCLQPATTPVEIIDNKRAVRMNTEGNEGNNT